MPFLCTCCSLLIIAREYWMKLSCCINSWMFCMLFFFPSILACNCSMSFKVFLLCVSVTVMEDILKTISGVSSYLKRIQKIRNFHIYVTPSATQWFFKTTASQWLSYFLPLSSLSLSYTSFFFPSITSSSHP